MHGERGKKRRENRKRRGGAQGVDDASVRSRGFLSHRFVNVKFLWRSRKTYRAGCHVADFQFPARESPAFKEEGGKGREGRERERERERKSAGVMGRSALHQVIVADCESARCMSTASLDQETRCKRASCDEKM